MGAQWFLLITFKCIFLVFTTIITELEIVIYIFILRGIVFIFLICEVLCCICILFIVMVFGIEFSHLEVFINITQPLKKLHESYQFMLFWNISQNRRTTILVAINKRFTPTLAEFQLYRGVYFSIKTTDIYIFWFFYLRLQFDFLSCLFTMYITIISCLICFPLNWRCFCSDNILCGILMQTPDIIKGFIKVLCFFSLLL